MTKVRIWLVVAALGVVLTLVVGWFLAISPQHSRAASLRAQVTEQEQTNERLLSQIRLLTTQQSALPSEEARIAAIQSKIPQSPGLPAYVRFLNTAATKTHVELVSVAPAAPVQAPAPSASPAPTSSATGTPAPAPATSAPGASVGDLYVINLSLSVIGDYFAIQQFLAELEKAPRSTVVTQVAIAPGELLQPQNAGVGGPSPTPSAAPPSSGVPEWQSLHAQIVTAIFMTKSAAATPAPTNAPAATSGTANS